MNSVNGADIISFESRSGAIDVTDQIPSYNYRPINKYNVGEALQQLRDDYFLVCDMMIDTLQYTQRLLNMVPVKKGMSSIRINIDAFDKNKIKNLPIGEQHKLISGMLAKKGIKVCIDDIKRGKKYPVGFMHRNAIKTLIERVLPSIIDNPSTNKLIDGLTQLGKSLLGQGFAVIFEPLIFAMTGRKLFIATVCTNKIAHGTQYNEELEVYADIWGDIVYESNATREFGSSYNEYQLLFKQDLCGNDILQSMTISRTNKKDAIANFSKVCNDAANAGLEVIFLVDENHHGADDDSIQDRIVDITINGDDLLVNENSNHIWIGLSATGYDFSHLTGIDVIRQFIGDGYCGNNMLHGEVYDKDAVSVITPTLISFDDIGTFYECEKLTDVKPRLVCDIDNYKKDPQIINGKKMSYSGYREYCIDLVIEFIKATLIDNDEDDKKILMYFRWSHRNDFTDMLSKRISKALDVGVIEFRTTSLSTHSNTKSISKRIDDIGEKKAIIFVTGSGRMADSFPPCVKYYVDFTDRIRYQSTLIQGTAGRATGYGKNSVIFMNRRHIGLLKKWYKTGKYVMRPTKNLELSEAIGGGRFKTNITISDNDVPADFVKAITDDVIRRNLSNKVSITKKGKLPIALASRKSRQERGLMASGRGYTEIHNVLTEKVWQYIESNTGITILRTGETTDVDDNEKLSGYGYDYAGSNCTDLIQDVGFRPREDTGHMAKRNEDDKITKRMIDDRSRSKTDTKKDKNRVLSPQIGVDFVDGEWKFCSIDLRTKHGYYSDFKSTNAVYLNPTCKSIAKHYRSDDEIDDAIEKHGEI